MAVLLVKADSVLRSDRNDRQSAYHTTGYHNGGSEQSLGFAIN